MTRTCDCVAGFYFDPTKGDCVECQCPSKSQQCFNAADDCNEEPYYVANLKEDNVVTDAVCVSPSHDHVRFFMMVGDGPYGAIYEINLRERNHTLFRYVKAQDSSSETGKNTFVCHWKVFLYINKI